MEKESDPTEPLLYAPRHRVITDDVSEGSTANPGRSHVLGYASINAPLVRQTAAQPPLPGGCAVGASAGKTPDMTPATRGAGDEGDGSAEVAPETPEYRVYKRRWYVLLMYSLIAATQGTVWNTFGPIASTAEDAFGWSDSTIALLSNWGPISYLVAGVFFSWVMDVKGLRLSCVLTAFLIALGTGLRCITVDSPNVTWLMHVGQALNGLAGPVAMAGPPAVSAVWFPPDQRTRATAVGSLFGMVGSAVGFIIGPLLVPDVSLNKTASNSSNYFNSYHLTQSSVHLNMSNQSVTLQSTGHYDVMFPFVSETDEQRIIKEKKAIKVFMYIEAGWSVGLFLIILAYFPKKPPFPPCASATIQREDFLAGIKQLFSGGKSNFWLLTIVYSVSIGVYNCWAGVLDVILHPFGIGEKEAGWIGFYSICSGAVMSLCVAWFADRFTKIMKWITLAFYVIGTGAFLIFTLAATKVIPDVIPPSTAMFYSTIIVGTTALNAAVPLLFELACELAYPTGEGTTNGVLTILCNFFGLIFLFVFMIPGIGTMWTNYTLVASAGICLPLLVVMKESYNRLNLDQHNIHFNTEIFVQPVN